MNNLIWFASKARHIKVFLKRNWHFLLPSERLSGVQVYLGTFYFFVWDKWDQIWRNFSNIGKLSKSLAIFLRVYLVFGKILNLLFKTFLILGKCSFLANGEILSKLSSHLFTLFTMRPSSSVASTTVLYFAHLKLNNYLITFIACRQCDQIWRFFGLWATF